jgi:hypothetical protein
LLDLLDELLELLLVTEIELLDDEFVLLELLDDDNELLELLTLEELLELELLLCEGPGLFGHAVIIKNNENNEKINRTHFFIFSLQSIIFIITS